MFSLVLTLYYISANRLSNNRTQSFESQAKFKSFWATTSSELIDELYICRKKHLWMHSSTSFWLLIFDKNQGNPTATQEIYKIKTTISTTRKISVIMSLQHQLW